MISVKRRVKSPFSNYSFEKTSGQYQVILTYLETNDAKKRRIGYALSIPKFDELPNVLKEIIRQKWLSEEEKEFFDKEFCSLCDRVFRSQQE